MTARQNLIHEGIAKTNFREVGKLQPETQAWVFEWGRAMAQHHRTMALMDFDREQWLRRFMQW